MPDTLISIENRLPKQCEDTTWPDDIEMTFNFYRVSVFFWILLGLVWLTGVVTIAVEGVKSKGRKFGFETRNATRKPTIQRLVVAVPSQVQTFFTPKRWNSMARPQSRMGRSRRPVPVDVRPPYRPPCRSGFPNSLFPPLDFFVFQKLAHQPRRRERGL